VRGRGGGRGGERVVGELDQPREQRARILRRRLGQPVVSSLFSLRLLVLGFFCSRSLPLLPLPCTAPQSTPPLPYHQWWCKCQTFDGDAEADALGFG
jgi:hypothetical protein